MSPSSSGASTLCKPPPHTEEDSTTVEEARAYLLPKRRLLHILPLSRWTRKNKKRIREVPDRRTGFSVQDGLLPTLHSAAEDGGLVELHNERLLSESGEDPDTLVYRWAVLYENQRGITILSAPYYSPQSLLPLDPPPYTLPAPKPSKRSWRTQPTVSLSSYPLPDGTWRWVSRAWMIDMRGDGLVQHDGFEYAWSFRSSRWRPEVGTLSAGAWVRRRRWIRLMERVCDPATQPDAQREWEDATVGDAEGEIPVADVAQDVPGATRPPSVAQSANEEGAGAEAMVWLGDEGDWERCRAALNRTGRDGRMLELWKRWFGFGFHSKENPRSVAESEDRKDKGKGKVPAHEVVDLELEEDTGVQPVPTPRTCIARIIRSHGSEVLRNFVFPDSRARFLEILDAANLLNELKSGPGLSDSTELLDFWSYASPPSSPNSGLKSEPSTGRGPSGYRM